MSGGSYNYAYRHIEELAFAIEATAGSSTCKTERRAFAELLKRCAEAARAIEWVDSGDYSPGGELKALSLVTPRADLLEAATRNALDVLAELQRVLASE